jgi:hypothetical protein
MRKIASRAFGALCLAVFASAALAGQESPTYKAGEVQCKGRNCWAAVVNDDGWGVIVAGKGRRATRKAAEAKAEELNAEAGEGAVVDPCFQNPETCAGLAG